MTSYDTLFLAEYEYRYPGREGQARIPAGLTIMSESRQCPYCRETLWSATMPDDELATVQDLFFFGQAGLLGEHTAENCETYYYGQLGRRAQELTREHNHWAEAHGYPLV